MEVVLKAGRGEAGGLDVTDVKTGGGGSGGGHSDSPLYEEMEADSRREESMFECMTTRLAA